MLVHWSEIENKKILRIDGRVSSGTFCGDRGDDAPKQYYSFQKRELKGLHVCLKKTKQKRSLRLFTYEIGRKSCFQKDDFQNKVFNFKKYSGPLKICFQKSQRTLA